jgi:GNAT superfamily N-acetyltransferase
MNLKFFKKFMVTIFIGLLGTTSFGGRKLIITRRPDIDSNDIHLELKDKNNKTIGKADLCSLGFIARLRVEKNWRGKGYGAFLFRSAIETLTALKCPMPITWEAAAFDGADQKKLVAFYLQLGGTIDYYNEKGFPQFKYDQSTAIKSVSALTRPLNDSQPFEVDLDTAKGKPIDNEKVLKVLGEQEVGAFGGFCIGTNAKKARVLQEYIAPFYAQYLPEVYHAKEKEDRIMWRYWREARKRE